MRRGKPDMNLTDKNLIEALAACSDRERAALAELIEKPRTTETPLRRLQSAAIRKVRRILKRQARREKV